MNSKQIKLASAIFGASAVAAMGALSAVAGETTVAEQPTAGPVTTSEITTGETITETVLPKAPETTAAEPEITTTPTSAEPG